MYPVTPVIKTIGLVSVMVMLSSDLWRALSGKISLVCEISWAVEGRRTRELLRNLQRFPTSFLYQKRAGLWFTSRLELLRNLHPFCTAFLYQTNQGLWFTGYKTKQEELLRNLHEYSTASRVPHSWGQGSRWHQHNITELFQDAPGTQVEGGATSHWRCPTTTLEWAGPHTQFRPI